MSYSVHLIKLKKNGNGTFLSVIKDDNGSERTAYINKKNMKEDAFYLSPEESVEYVALIQTTDNGGSFIKQLLPSELHPLGKVLMVDVFGKLMADIFYKWLVPLIKDKEHTFSFISRDDNKKDRFYFNLSVANYVIRISAWFSDLVKLGIETEKLKEGDILKGMAKVTEPNDGRFFVNFALADCQNYEGKIQIERSFEKDGIKHFVFTKIPSDGSRFVIKQPEFYPHGVIDFFEPEGQGDVRIYEFKGTEKYSRGWRVEFIKPLMLKGECINQNHCAYEGISAYNWYARNQELFSPFGKVNRNLQHYALQNHLVCEVVTEGQAQMLIIPASLLKAKGLKRLEAGTRLKGVARYLLLDVFQTGHMGWLADNVEILDDDKDKIALPKLSKPRVETLKFKCEKTSQGDLRQYIFTSLDGAQDFLLKDYIKQMISLTEPKRYHFIVKVKSLEVKEILSAELQS